ncbi:MULTISPECIES: TorF family putative porin [unclassified Variovorax]|uniref:TorF family putative porin n=1 Tax=unclassified Variovorax TaxID=663243 RepID=UPI001BD1EE90|nr:MULTISPECIES: TorF family putative porin [unclassified Variovorax]
MPATGLRVALVPPLVLACGAAFAQVGWNIAFLSDDRYRGVSLSDGQPAVRLSVGFDAPSGWFGGASLTSVSLGQDERQLQMLGYGGFVGRLTDRLGWEAGVIAVHYTADTRYDYGEAFAGLTGERWNLRVHYAPDYFGSGARTVYTEFNVGLPLSQMTRATAHAGALVQVGGVPAAGERTTLDGSLGLAVGRDAWEVRLEWVAGGRAPIHPIGYRRAASSALVLSASLAF